MTTFHIETSLTSLKLIKLGCFSSIITSISSKIKSVQMWIKIHANKINLGNARFFSGEVFSNKKTPSERNSNANCVFGLLPIFMLFVRKGTENWFQIFIHHCNICKKNQNWLHSLLHEISRILFIHSWFQNVLRLLKVNLLDGDLLFGALVYS